ncbi:uncharacterized protein LOC130458989 isoform X2 [Monodelphis domestica]|uniref:uncharacterized protein LOC130458989 isoform X2 n=1 Tax=Monodelphis domestica TaxID=13616 RepID=UPI0024E2300B|nr:uncharacterized protein LOC130458989 isoform X2 [Monodelphis domestica]
MMGSARQRPPSLLAVLPADPARAHSPPPHDSSLKSTGDSGVTTADQLCVWGVSHRKAPLTGELRLWNARRGHGLNIPTPTASPAPGARAPSPHATRKTMRQSHAETTPIVTHLHRGPDPPPASRCACAGTLALSPLVSTRTVVGVGAVQLGKMKAKTTWVLCHASKVIGLSFHINEALEGLLGGKPTKENSILDLKRRLLQWK